jgi:hypothetical protein
LSRVYRKNISKIEILIKNTIIKIKSLQIGILVLLIFVYQNLMIHQGGVDEKGNRNDDL